MENNYKHKSLRDFSKAQPSEYRQLQQDGLLEQLCFDMGWKKIKPAGYWDIKEHCLEEALKYNTVTEWGMGNSASIKSAKLNGWYEECNVHMLKQNVIPRSYWTKELCVEEAKKCSSRTDWSKKSDGSYKMARKNGWMEECTAHMVEINKPSGYWTKERCHEEALKYATRNEWRETHRTSYQAAMTNKFLSECTTHMEYTRAKTGYWNNKEFCLEEAKKYMGRFEWQKKHRSSYEAARRNGWLDECCEHMIKFYKN